MSVELTSAVAELKEFKPDPRVQADGIVLGFLEVLSLVCTALLSAAPPDAAEDIEKVRKAIDGLHQAKLDSLA